MIALGIKVEFSRRVAKAGAGEFGAVLNSGAFATAVGLAQAAQRRVGVEGRPEQPFRGYSGRGQRLVSPRYPVSGGRVGPSGVQIFEDTGTLHRGTRPGSFAVTRGMWRGLSTVVSGRSVARNKFRGRSEGQGMARSRRGDEPYFDERGRPHPRKVSNATKASTVLSATGINVLLPTREEYAGVAQAAVDMARMGITQAMVANVDFVTPRASRSALAQAIMAHGIIGNLEVHAGGGFSLRR